MTPPEFTFKICYLNTLYSIFKGRPLKVYINNKFQWKILVDLNNLPGIVVDS